MPSYVYRQVGRVVALPAAWPRCAARAWAAAPLVQAAARAHLAPPPASAPSAARFHIPTEMRLLLIGPAARAAPRPQLTEFYHRQDFILDKRQLDQLIG